MQSTFLSRLRAFFAQGNRTTWTVFLLFSTVLFIKTMVFHWTCFHSVLISSLWTFPTEFFRFWLGKVNPILFLGAFIFITKRYWWTIVANLLADIWMIANLFYYKANTLFLSVETMKMADNMTGFWDSLLPLMGRDIYILPICTILYTAVLLFLHLQYSSQRKYTHFAITLITSIIFMVLCNYFYGKSIKLYRPSNVAVQEINEKWQLEEIFTCYYPFGTAYYYARKEVSVNYDAFTSSYVQYYSILSNFASCIVYSLLSPAGEIITLNETQKKELERYIIPGIHCDSSMPKTNLIFILVESLESWAVDYDNCGYTYMPNLRHLIEQEHTLYANKLCSQVKHGNSADGQMIGITGLLPISNGATCNMYDNNTYPNYVHFYPYSAIINPVPDVWNQSVMTYRYQFQELIEPKSQGKWEDKEVMENVSNYALKQDNSFCVLGITISSHMPFAYGANHPKYIVPNMPNIMSAYLNCLNYTDSCIGAFLETIQHSSLANNTTIVFTGDHTRFHNQDSEMDKFAREHNIPMQTGHTFTPLIIYSPKIEGNVQVTDTCYQMDIFPTILHLIGAEDYYWHGFGVNLLDSAARHNRPCTEQEAFRLSDLMIQSDYFRKYMNPKE